MRNLHHWLQIVETVKRPQTIRVFHGSPEKRLILKPEMLYGTRDFGFAASYALERRQHTVPVVYTLDFRFQNLCSADALDDLFEKHDIDPSPSAAGVFISHPEFIQVLVAEGYDGLTANDFGFRDEFEERPVWMVANAAKQAKIIASTAVTKADMQRTYEPG
jgi:hypothetical protein